MINQQSDIAEKYDVVHELGHRHHLSGLRSEDHLE